MAKKTQIFTNLPWNGGMNTAVDPTLMLPADARTVYNIEIQSDGTKKKRDGLSQFDDAAVGSDSIIGLFDYWRTNSSTGAKEQLLIGVDSAGKFYSYSSTGTRTTLTNSGAAVTGSVTSVSFEVLNNTLIIALSGSGNTPKKYNPDDSSNIQDLGGSPPDFSFCRLHLGRLWTNDKDNPERLHYSSISNFEEWNGTGDSGALDIFPGDGDPKGLTAIFPSFKRNLFVTKRTKLYQIGGLTPEDFQISPLSDGIGCVAHSSAAAVDQDDVYFVSDRGVHSLVTTAEFGDFKSKFTSLEIQPTVNDWEDGRKERITAEYIPTKNAIAFGVSDEGSEFNNAVYFFHTITEKWYKWPTIPSEAIATRLNGDVIELLFGTSTGIVLKADNGTAVDWNSSNVKQQITSGSVYPQGGPNSLVAFKRLWIYYRSDDALSLTVDFRVDDQLAQTLTFTSASPLDLLGVDFILGESVLGALPALAPVPSVEIKGVGRGCSLSVREETTAKGVKILGYGIEWEPAEIAYDK